MKSALGALVAEEQLTVLCANERYGAYFATGSVRISELDDVYVAGQLIASRKETDKKSGETVRQPTSHLKQITQSPDFRSDPISVDEATTVQHGDFVNVAFICKPYGEFSIAGIATAGERGVQTLVGDWIITNGESPAPTVQALQVVARTGTHVEDVPQRRGSLNSNETI